MSFHTDLAQFLTSGFPNRAETDPAKKTPAWIRQMAAGGLTELWRSKAHWGLWAFDNDIANNLKYALGEQDTNQYTRMGKGGAGLNANSIEVTNRDGHFDEAGDYHGRRGSGGGATDPTGLDSIINAPPLPILPTKIQALKSLIKQRYEITITALGQKAKKQRAEHEAEVRLWMDLGDNMRELGMPMPEGMPDPMPQTEPELQTYLSMWQVQAAADLELKIQIADVESDIEQLMDEIATDLLTHGYGGLFDFYQAGKRTVSKRILPGRGLFLPSAYPDYRDADMGGVFDTIPFETVRAEVQGNEKYTCNADGKPWKKEDWEAVQRLAAHNISAAKLSEMDSELGQREGTGAITVVRWYFRTDNRRTWKTYIDKANNKRTRPQGAAYEIPEGEKGKLTEATVNCLYECTLICGTGLAYNCRKVFDQGRDLHDPLKARLPFALFSEGVTMGKPVSIVRRVKGIVDEMERSWRGFMAVRRTYVPEGSNYPPDLLLKMAEAMKVGGENPAMAAYAFIRTSGDSFFLRQDTDNPNIPIQNPITANPFGIPKAASDHLTHFFQQMQILEALTGANAVVSAATPGSEAGKGVNQIALQGAANLMGYARNGLRKVYENHAKNLAGRIWATDAEIPTTGTVPGPDGAMREVGPRKDFHEYAFHMRVELGPSDEEWERLYQKAAEARAQGQITIGDEVYIEWLRNLKTAQRYLVVAVQKKAREDQKNKLAEMQANADSQTQAAQATAAAQQETVKMSHTLEMERLAFQRETAWGTVERQTAAQQLVAQGNNETKLAASASNDAARVEAARINQAGELARTAADNQHDHEATALNAVLTPEPTPAAA